MMNIIQNTHASLLPYLLETNTNEVKKKKKPQNSDRELNPQSFKYIYTTVNMLLC